MNGQVVAITGAGQGIGRGLALAFAKQGARAVVVSDVNQAAVEAVAQELRELGAQALAVCADVTSTADNARLVTQTVASFGRLDVMVCNAGIVQVKPLLALEAEDWDRLLAVNVKGCFLSLQAAARAMRQQAPLAPGRPRGKIITMASIAGRSGAGPIAALIAPYRASNAAVITRIRR